LGESFLAAATTAFKQIQAQPRSFQLVREEVRRAIVQRFPYFVFYLFERGQIVVLAVLHTSRNPALRPRSRTDTR
jgi:plasmid stabilization system protein ParE